MKVAGKFSTASMAVLIAALASPVVMACTPPVNERPSVDVCKGTVADFSADAKACGPDKSHTMELQLSLANGLFMSCESMCVYNIMGGERGSTFKYSKSGKCWQKKKGRKCQAAMEGENAFGANKLADLCQLSQESLPAGVVDGPQAPADVVVTQEEVEVAGDPLSPCIPVRTEAVTQTQMDQFCSHDTFCESAEKCVSSNGVHHGASAVGCDEEDTFAVQLALANGMFGAGAGYERNCRSKCLMDFLGSESHFEWRSGAKCWLRVDGYHCGKESSEAAFATQRKTQFCTIPTINPAPYECVQVRNELTTELMTGLCAHDSTDGDLCDDDSCISSQGTDLGPDALACDAEDQHNVLLSLANGLFGGNSGTARDCGAHCLYDYIEPDRVAYKWDASEGCWDRKKGPNACNFPSQRDYAVSRQSTLCPPTMAPTLAPSFTMPPTAFPTNPPTTSAPTVQPTVSPTVSAPTVAPTVSTPTVSPTHSPSVSPTVSPTASPTVHCNQFHYELSAVRVMELCPSITCVGDDCESEVGANLGPNARACDARDQEQLELSIANGMFGGPAAGAEEGEDEERNCDAICVWDHTNPNKRSYKWKGDKGCWMRKSRKCVSGDKPQRLFAEAQQQEWCTNKDPSQQVLQAPNVQRHMIRGRRVVA